MKKEFWTGAVFLAMFFYILYLIKDNNHIKREFDERVVSTKQDTLNVDDTTYLIRHLIIKKYYEPQPEQPEQERP